MSPTSETTAIRGRPPHNRRRSLIIVLLTLAAAGATLEGLWIPAKAVLAQLLLQRSWQQARHGATAPPPWPWADTTPVARLRLPRLHVDQLVLAGASGAELAFGPGLVSGLMAGAALPGPLDVAGSNTVVAGHRDTHFRFLRHVAIGDRITVESADGSRHAYAVRWTQVVAEDAIWVTRPTAAEALTLITCYPFDGIAGQADRRFVVRAQRVAQRDAG